MSLNNALQKLRQEIQQIPPDNAAMQEWVEAVSEGVNASLEHADKPRSARHRNLAQVLREAADKLETAHPRLTEAINQVLNALSNTGI